jgi:hypothetical protein
VNWPLGSYQQHLVFDMHLRLFNSFTNKMGKQQLRTKVETPYHDNDLILTPITKWLVVNMELPGTSHGPVLGMEDGNF